MIGAQQVAFHLRVQRGRHDLGAFGVEGTVEHAHPAEGRRKVQATTLVQLVIGRGAAIAVERIGESAHDGAQLARLHAARNLDQLRFDFGDGLYPFRRARVGDEARVLTGDLTRRERGRGLGKLRKPARERECLHRGAVRHVRAGPEPRRRTHETLGRPVAALVEATQGPHLEEFDLLGDAAQLHRIEPLLRRRRLGHGILEVIEHSEHVFDSRCFAKGKSIR